MGGRLTAFVGLAWQQTFDLWRFDCVPLICFASAAGVGEACRLYSKALETVSYRR